MIQILDEILDLLLSLLAEVFGIEFRIAARTFSELEVNFWRELAAFESLRQMQTGRSPKAEEA